MKKLLLLIFPLLILLQGCLNYIQDINLYADGSGRMRITYWMQLHDNESLQILDKIGLFNPDSIRSQFSSAFNKITDVEVYTDTTDSTIHAKMEMTFNHIDSLNNTKAFSDAHFSLEDGAAGQKIFTQFIPPIATGFGFDGSDFMVTYKYTFGGEIITHNATKTDGRVLIWEYNLSEIGGGKTISVTFKPYKLKETPYWIYILSGVVLLIVIIFLFKKKKD